MPLETGGFEGYPFFPLKTLKFNYMTESSLLFTLLALLYMGQLIFVAYIVSESVNENLRKWTFNFKLQIAAMCIPFLPIMLYFLFWLWAVVPNAIKRYKRQLKSEKQLGSVWTCGKCNRRFLTKDFRHHVCQ